MKKGRKNRSKAEKISRKAAIRKMGYTAFTGATMMFLLNNPAKAEDGEASPELPPIW